MGRGTKRLAALGVLAAFVIATGVAGAAGTLFQPYYAYDVGSWPEAVAVGDATGDALSDVVLTTGSYADPANDFRVWVFAQTTSGSLATPVSYATGQTQTPESVAVGDVTGDGRADVLVGLEKSGGVQVFAQLADGVLGAPVSYPAREGRLVRLGHLDGDGRLDVALLGWGTNTVSVLLNNGAGGFQAPVQYPVRHAGYDDLEVGDVTGDGLDDLVVMSGQLYAVPNVSVVPQLAEGGFGPPAEYRVDTNLEASFNTNGIGIGELSGDDRLDVVASLGGNRPSSRIAFFTQTEEGTLADPVIYASYDIPEPVEVADVDLDGRDDVVTLHGGWNRAGVYPQDVVGGSSGEDLYPIPYASHYGPHGLALGDVSGDGRPEVVIADYNHGLVVLSSEAVVPPPSPDTTPPVVSVAGPDSGTQSENATFTFSADEPATFRCALDAAALAACASGISYSGLQPGEHVFRVEATDAAGNVGSATHTWTIAAPPKADVGVDVAAFATRVRPKRSFWFDVTVTNAGPDASGAALTVQLTGGPTSLTESSSACALQGSTVTCSFTSLAPGGSATVRISGVAPKSGTLRAAAVVDGAVEDPNAANDTDSASIVVR
jgi:Domain of unknown function DUF11/FG-GAP-like repeat